MYVRAVPAMMEAGADHAKFLWVNDAVDVATILRTELDVAGLGEPDRSQVPNMAAAGALLDAAQKQGLSRSGSTIATWRAPGGYSTKLQFAVGSRSDAAPFAR